jgi:hypothetical protein
LVKATQPTQEDFAFLDHYNNASVVESGMELLASAVGVSITTLVNQGLWYGVCKTPEIISGLASRYKLDSHETEDMEKLKTDFCLQLSYVIATSEVALAGHVAPWPIEQVWWQPLRFAGVGIYAYRKHTDSKNTVTAPVAALTYLVVEASMRTAGSTVSSLLLRKTNDKSIIPFNYTYQQYTDLSTITGLVLGDIIYRASIRRGLKPPCVAFAFITSALITTIILTEVSTSLLNTDELEPDDALTQNQARATNTILAGITTSCIAGFATAVKPGAIAGTVAVVPLAGMVGESTTTISDILIIGLAIGLTSGFVYSLITSNSKTASNNPVIEASVTVGSALSFALLNSLANYFIYGNPIEESISETGQTLWKKFYAPLDYLTTVFN